jgi:hypothetical protein
VTPFSVKSLGEVVETALAWRTRSAELQKRATIQAALLFGLGQIDSIAAAQESGDQQKSLESFERMGRKLRTFVGNDIESYVSSLAGVLGATAQRRTPSYQPYGGVSERVQAFVERSGSSK